MSTSSAITAYWDSAAGSFDDEADHGLCYPDVRDAWAARLNSWLPDPPLDVLDLGCGTGSLSLLLAQQGKRVVGVDLAPKMVEQARTKFAKAAVDAHLLVGDAAAPPLLQRRFGAVVARHVLWTLPEPAAALRRWVDLCHPGGRLVLIEGRWNAPTEGTPYPGGPTALPWMGGVTARVLTEALQRLVSELRVEPLTDPRLWGRPVDDERYAVIATV